jgi:hypothetical protein
MMLFILPFFSVFWAVGYGVEGTYENIFYLKDIDYYRKVLFLEKSEIA